MFHCIRSKFGHDHQRVAERVQVGGVRPRVGHATSGRRDRCDFTGVRGQLDGATSVVDGDGGIVQGAHGVDRKIRPRNGRGHGRVRAQHIEAVLMGELMPKPFEIQCCLHVATLPKNRHHFPEQPHRPGCAFRITDDPTGKRGHGRPVDTVMGGHGLQRGVSIEKHQHPAPAQVIDVGAPSSDCLHYRRQRRRSDDQNNRLAGIQPFQGVIDDAALQHGSIVVERNVMTDNGRHLLISGFGRRTGWASDEGSLPERTRPLDGQLPAAFPCVRHSAARNPAHLFSSSPEPPQQRPRLVGSAKPYLPWSSSAMMRPQQLS